MKRAFIASHDPKTHNHLHSINTLQNTANGHLDNIHKVLTQDGQGGGNKAGVILDHISSALNDMKQHTDLCQSRLNNVQNHLTQNGDGTGTSHGPMLDSCASSLNTIESNSTLTASRLNNVQNKLSANTDGTGDTLGELVVSNNTKLDAIETDIESTNTLLTTIDGVLDNILVKNTEIDTAVDLVNTNLTTIDGVLDNIKTAHDTHNLGVHSSHTNVINNATFTAGSYSSAMDILVSGTNELYRDISIYGKFDDGTSPSFHLAFSSDDVTYYIDPNPALTVGDGTNKHFVMSAENCPFRYVKVYNTSTAAANNCYLYWVGLKRR